MRTIDIHAHLVPTALWQAITRALRAYGNRGRWEGIVSRGMRADFSWQHSALCYESLYERTLAAKGVGTSK